jgi:hypothetical protein
LRVPSSNTTMPTWALPCWFRRISMAMVVAGPSAVSSCAMLYASRGGATEGRSGRSSSASSHAAPASPGVPTVFGKRWIGAG